MNNDTLQNLYVEELKDIYSAENQILKALPKMAKAATSEALKAGFEEHLKQTEHQVERLQKIFTQLDETPTGKKCHGMEGLLKEGAEAIEEFEGDVLDAALISAAQRVEHYEMAAYGTVRTYAELLNEPKHVSLLAETLQEEKDTDQKLTKLSQQINLDANEAGQDGPSKSKANGVKSNKNRERVA
ncbi:MAG TPA: ferritin-like domain-containing protein [Terriglobales bacterium]|nr:ferritin-like domain-containing protein [Terriglobales bacterium]